MSNQILETIQNRRAVFQKQYHDTDISEQDLQTILEAANAAPTHKRTEPWRFVIFKNKGLSKLGTELSRIYQEITPEKEYNPKKAEKTKEKATSANVAFAIIVHYSGKVPEWEELAATACAVQNMWLASHSLGIGAYWSSPKTIHHLDDFLGLKDNQECIGLFYMGHADLSDSTPKRGDIEGKILRRIEE